MRPNEQLMDDNSEPHGINNLELQDVRNDLHPDGIGVPQQDEEEPKKDVVLLDGLRGSGEGGKGYTAKERYSLEGLPGYPPWKFPKAYTPYEKGQMSDKREPEQPEQT